MLAIDVIEAAQRKGNSPFLFNPWKDGTLRFSVGYRKLNSVKIRD